MDKETLELIQTIPKEVWLQLYNDAPRPLLKQFGKLGEDLAKTLRLLTLPIQCTAYIQDRVDEGFKNALEKIPEERRMKPHEGLVLDIADKLKNHESKTLIGKLYIELLSASMDRERVNQAHPAFLPVIAQLSRDEALLLLRISQLKTLLSISRSHEGELVTLDERHYLLSQESLRFNGVMRKLVDLTLNPEEYHYPENYQIYLEHLTGLGLIENDSAFSTTNWFGVMSNWGRGTEYKFSWFKLTKFGELFFACCTDALIDLDG